jgi:hypothetical protein
MRRDGQGVSIDQVCPPAYIRTVDQVGGGIYAAFQTTASWLFLFNVHFFVRRDGAEFAERGGLPAHDVGLFEISKLRVRRNQHVHLSRRGFHHDWHEENDLANGSARPGIPHRPDNSEFRG